MPKVTKRVRLINPARLSKTARNRKHAKALEQAFRGDKPVVYSAKASYYSNKSKARQVNRFAKSNPTKRKLSPLQKLFFGSKRQRTAVAKKLGRKKNPSFRRDKGGNKSIKVHYGTKNLLRAKKSLKLTSTTRRKKRRLPNVGQILAVTPLMNPRKRRKVNPKSVTMAKRKASRKRPYGASFIASGPRRRKRLRYAGKAKRGQYKYILNPRRRRKVTRRRKSYARKANPTVVIMRSRRRRTNPSRRRHTTRHHARRRYSRRRNPGFLPKGGMLLKVGGFFSGVLITNMVKGILPAQFRSGVMGILGTGISAWVASKAIRMVTGNAALANAAFFGGQTVTVVSAIKEFAPGVAANLPGLGLIAPSNSLYPQIPSAGAIGPPYDQAVIRGMIPAAVAMRGLPAPNVLTRNMRQR